MSETRRTVREVILVVETKLSAVDHEKRVAWAEKNILNANTNMDGAFVATVVFAEDGSTRFQGSGTPTKETQDIIEELVANES